MLLMLSLGERQIFRALFLAAPHLAAPPRCPAQYSRHNSLADFLRRPSGRRSLLHSRVALAKVSAGERVDTGFLLESGVICVQVAPFDVNPKDSGYCELCTTFPSWQVKLL